MTPHPTPHQQFMRILDRDNPDGQSEPMECCGEQWYDCQCGERFEFNPADGKEQT